MEEKNPLDIKFLEKSLERVEKSAETWIRDVAIFLVLVIVFQFAVFLPAMDLFKKQEVLDKTAIPLQNQEKILKELDQAITDVADAIKLGGKKLGELLTQTPIKLRKEISGLDGEISSYRQQQKPPENPTRARSSTNTRNHTPSSTNMPYASSAHEYNYGTTNTQDSSHSAVVANSYYTPTTQGANYNYGGNTSNYNASSYYDYTDNTDYRRSVSQSEESLTRGSDYLSTPINYSSTQYLIGIDEEKLKLLIEPDANKEKFQQLIQEIVEKSIISPHFVEMNQSKVEQLDTPLEIAENALIEKIKKFPIDTSVNNSQAFVDGITNLQKALANLRSVKLAPPVGKPEWWHTIEGKSMVANANRINIGQVISESETNLIKITTTMKVAETNLQDILTSIKQEKKNIEEKLTDVEKQYKEASKLMGELGKPFTFVLINLNGAVVAFPIVALLLCVWLFWRLKYLREKGSVLFHAFGDHSVSDIALQSVIPTFIHPVSTPNLSISRRVQLFSIGLIVLVFYDTYTLHNTILAPNAPSMVVLLASIVLLIGFAYFFSRKEAMR